MLTRREAISLLTSVSVGASLLAAQARARSLAGKAPPLAHGTPTSAERLALIAAFQTRSAGLENTFEKRTHKGDWEMPYRLFRPQTPARLPLVVYLHGSGGQGDDNEKQLALGNVFGTRVWLLPENQKRFPCYVVVPQTDRGWIRYDPGALANGVAKAIPGLGEGARLALEIVDGLRREFPIDDRRIYVTGQSMGGGGVWNMLTYGRPSFAAAVSCCGSVPASADGAGSIETPLWAFHGDADQTVPVSVSRERIAVRRKAGGRPLYTEYAGVGHNVWEWAFTEPDLVPWIFGQHRA